MKELDIGSKINTLDVTIFQGKSAQYSSKLDKQSLLALQSAVRKLKEGYVYLEIGSYMGGSIQPHLMDYHCRKVYSIDKRIYSRPLEDDNKAEFTPFRYKDNSTETMLEILKQICPEQIGKIICFDDDAKNINPSLIEEKVDLCFIDGEHTDKAVFSDFLFCLTVINHERGIIAFHDSSIVYKGIMAITRELKKHHIKFRAIKLGGSVYAIALGHSQPYSDPNIKKLARNGYIFLYMMYLLSPLRFKIPERFKPFLRQIYHLLLG